NEAELDNYFLVAMVDQWKNAKEQPALIRADRALVFAFEQNRLAREEIMAKAGWALRGNELEAAAKLFEQVKKLAPHDEDADAGLKVVAKMRDGKLNKERLKDLMAKPDDQAIKVEKGEKGKVKLERGKLHALAQMEDPVPPAKGGKVEEKKVKDGDDPALQDRRNRELIEEQRIVGVVEHNPGKARKLIDLDPDAARDAIKPLLKFVQDNADLGDKVRQNLANRMENMLRDIEIRGADIKL